MRKSFFARLAIAVRSIVSLPVTANRYIHGIDRVLIPVDL